MNKSIICGPFIINLVLERASLMNYQLGNYAMLRVMDKVLDLDFNDINADNVDAIIEQVVRAYGYAVYPVED